MDSSKEIEERYNRLKKKVFDSESERPSVMLNAPYADSWFLPSSKNYMVHLIEDAGGTFILNRDNGSSSFPIDMEEAMMLVSNADFWLNIGDFKTKDALLQDLPKFSKMKCVTNDNLYNNNKITGLTGGLDFFESGAVNPDLILRDLVKIFHPSLVEEDFVYYRQLK